MRHFPVFLDLQDAPVLIVGGGEIAARKMRLLREAGASITVVAPQLAPAIEARVRQGMSWIPRRFEPADVAGMRLVIAATDDREVNAAVVRGRAARQCAGQCRRRCASSRASSCRRSWTARRSSSRFRAAASAPVLATRLRARIEALLDDSWGRLGDVRRSLAPAHPRAPSRSCRPAEAFTTG